jgi:DNA-binding MarR family transcriptional regulator
LQERLSADLSSVHGLALNEALLLMHLERAPLQRLSRVDVARRLHLNPSTVTRMAAPLEKIGLLGRQSDPRDARLAYMLLTSDGVRVASEVRVTIERRSVDVFRDRWTEEERQTLADLLARMTSNEPGELV